MRAPNHPEGRGSIVPAADPARRVRRQVHGFGGLPEASRVCLLPSEHAETTHAATPELEEAVGTRESPSPPAPAAELDEIREELAHLKARLGQIEERLNRLEVREELWQTPDLAGDEPVGELPS